MKAFLKANWKTVIIYSLLSILLVVALVVNVRKCMLEKDNGTIIIDSDTFIEMIEDDKDFILVLGQEDCSACKLFNATLREYTKENDNVYYLYVDNENDLRVMDALGLIRNKMSTELPLDKRTTKISTPTTIYIEDGLFKDVVVGYVDTDDRNEYKEFKDAMKGKNVVRKTTLTEEEFLEKLNNGDDFAITFGSTTCGHCKAFEDTIHSYVNEGHSLYYLYINESSSGTQSLVIDKIMNDLPIDREILIEYQGLYYLGTPTTVYIEDGVFRDAYAGYIALDNENYQTFKDVIQGEYKDLAYPFA